MITNRIPQGDREQQGRAGLVFWQDTGKMMVTSVYTKQKR